MAFLHRPRLLTSIAFVAVGLTSLLVDRPVEGGTIPGLSRSAQMRRVGCCCPNTPAGGCCCEPLPAAPTETAVQGQAVALVSTTLLVSQAERREGSCECRSQSPSEAIDEPDRRTHERRTDLADGANRTAASSDAARAPSCFIGHQPARPSRCPLYLGLSHLLL